MGVPERDPLSQLSLPPGFRFYPTDEELLVQYLCRKVADQPFNLQIIGDIDLYKFDPWVLPSKAIFGEKEWYFFSPRDRKYPNGSRPNRVAGSGYWKATGTDKIIVTEGRMVGIKKALVFYIGKAPKGTKTNWIMHEYRLSQPPHQHRQNPATSKLDDWVLCRIYKKNSSRAAAVKSTMVNGAGEFEDVATMDDVMETFPELDDRFFALPGMDSLLAASAQPQNDDETLSLQNILDGAGFEWSNLAAATAGLKSGTEFNPLGNGGAGLTQNQNQVVEGGGGMYGQLKQGSLEKQRAVTNCNGKCCSMTMMMSTATGNSGMMMNPNVPNSFGIGSRNLSTGFGFGQ